MKITAINGSPNIKDSLSGRIIGQIEKLLGVKTEARHAIKLINSTAKEDAFALLDADVLLIVFPLYVDSFPMPLIEVLTRLKEAAKGAASKPRVYAIVNCGLYEQEQTALVLNMARHFAEESGLPWGYGLGIGHGGMLSSFGDDWSKGPASVVYKALSEMAGAIHGGSSGPDVFAAPAFPRFLYNLAANWGFRSMAKKNGVLKTIRARPYARKEAAK